MLRGCSNATRRSGRLQFRPGSLEPLAPPIDTPATLDYGTGTIGAATTSGRRRVAGSVPTKPTNVRQAVGSAVASAAASSAARAQQRDERALYKDPAAEIEARVADLLARMTLAEKLVQITSVWDSKTEIFDERSQLDHDKLARRYPDGIGQFARPSDGRGPASPRLAPGRDTAATIELVNALQRYAVGETRLGIPILFHEEALHGYAAPGATSFPQPIALASSFDPELVRKVDAVIAREVRARGVHLVLSPVVDVARDPRWGRIEETFGEDPHLVGEMGVAAVEGLQGVGHARTLGADKVFATLKHLTGHGEPESGTNVGPAPISRRELRDVFLPPFEQVVKRTAISSLMASYNEIDGVPSHANRWLLHDVLRAEWGYRGAIVSDYYAIDQLVDLHHVAADRSEAARLALAAGIDCDLPNGGSYSTLAAAVESGALAEADVDTAVRRILDLKFRAGLFERPYADAARAARITNDAEARELARVAAERSIVLLKNDGVLPLQLPAAAPAPTIAVIGPNAAVARLGGYSGEPPTKVSLLDGVRAKVGDRARIVYAEGVAITKSDDWWADRVELADPGENRAKIAAAVEAARAADVIVLALGDTEQTSREGWAANHLGDRASLDLVGEQQALFDALHALGKPVVVVLINGRPASTVAIAAQASALVEAWYLGEQGGHALANVLFGDVAPGGKLPVTIPRSAGQLPMCYDYKPSARRGYLFGSVEPLFPFGWGLSYTTFDDRRAAALGRAHRHGRQRRGQRRGPQQRRARGRRDGADLPARRGRLRHAARQGAQGLRAREPRARRVAHAHVHAEARGLRALGPAHGARRRARRVRRDGRPEFGGLEERDAHGRGPPMSGRRNWSRRDLVKLAAAATTSAVAGAGLPRALAARRDEPVYRNAGAPVAARVEDLLARMTLEEKVAQMIALWARKAEISDGLAFAPDKASAAYPHGIGQIARPSDKRGAPGAPEAAGGPAKNWRTPAETVAFVNAVQKWAVERTRLGIPVLFHEESLHGYMATEATMFPQAIAMAGTFDTDLVREIGAVIAREVRARGVALVLSPVVDIARDPRWGRIEETFGEDPHLVAEMGVAAVEGLQGRGKLVALGPDKVFATLKHMTGHGQPASGNNVSPAPIAERELRENFFPPFRSVVERTSIGALMPSYNEIDGVPSHTNRWLLEDVLREEWGFGGIVVSDYNGISQLASLHHVAADAEDAARQALAAGVDCELPDGAAYPTLVAQVGAGKVPVAAIDRAVARILALKFRAGLFERPYGDARLTARVTGNAEAQALALTAARKSLCLLKNDGTLPFERRALKRIAVIGPNANVARLGGYSSVPKRSVTLLDGVRALVGPDVEVINAQGAFITQSEDRSANEVLLADPERNRVLIGEAVAAARGADAIVLAIGDTEQTSREGFATNHLGDRSELDLVGEQNELFDALRELGKPVVVCALNGRPPSWPNVAANANAILECWYPGQEGGTAMAEALFGEVNPGAKLPVTVVRDSGQIPFFYNHKPSARRGYLFEDKAALYPFGHGLSYTTFTIGAPELSARTIGAGGSVDVLVTVTNAGARAGDEVVQLYVRDVVASVTRPVRELKGFQRVTLEPGESRRLRFTLGPDAFKLWDARMREGVEPGRFEISAGPDSVNLESAVLEVV